jgi:short-subunit dehydrogenase
MFNYAGKTVLITGASAGIGEAFARLLAQRGSHLILIARSEDKLKALSKALTDQYRVKVEVISSDLSQPGAAQSIYQSTQERGLQVDLLINSAGFGTYGPFETISPEREYEQVVLNNAALVAMTRLFITQMLERREGGIINLASMVGFQPDPYMAVYGATKAFVLSFSEALWAEYRGKGVRVLALCPGAVQTEFIEKLGEGEVTQGSQIFAKKDTPDRIAALGLKALEQDRNYAVNGFNNYLLAQSSRFFPRAWVVRISARLVANQELKKR